MNHVALAWSGLLFIFTRAVMSLYDHRNLED